ncbi:MAG: NUDIX domain-containing protein [Rhizobiaceae bacterium]|nr:NUDIX domain-containing protein [Rhizobiaceae bacterium]
MSASTFPLTAASPIVLGVSACVFRAGKVLLVERDRPPFKGLWTLPGGRVEFGERMEAAIAREVREETGFDLPSYPFFCLHEAISDGVHAVIAVHRGVREIPVGTEPVSGGDARSCKFVEISDLAAMDGAAQLTSGLIAIVESAHRAHLLGL